MIDLTYACQEFDHYLDSFDRENDKIKLKIVHTEGVVRAAHDIAVRMDLQGEDVELAQLIALLHDIGRFEQVKRFNSFEPFTMDHAAFGVELLFENKEKKSDEIWLRKFIKDDSYDQIIQTAIARHSLYDVGEIQDPRIMLHSKLIRDADKLDNCRVKLEEPIEVLLGMDGETVGSQLISDIIWKTCLAEKSIVSSDRITKMDYWVSYIAYFYDINFKETFDIIRENDYVNRIIDRIRYTNPDTKRKMEILRQNLCRKIGSR